MRWPRVLLFVTITSITFGGALAIAQQRATPVEVRKRVESLQRRTDVELGKLSTSGLGTTSSDRAAFEALLKQELASVGVNVDPSTLADIVQTIMKGGPNGMALALVVALSIAEIGADAESSTTTDDSGVRGDPKLRAQVIARLHSVRAAPATPKIVEGWLAQPGVVTFTAADFEACGKLAPAEGMKTLRETTNKRFAAALERKR